MKAQTDKTSLEYKRAGITVRIRPKIKDGVERFVADYRVKGVRKLVWRSSLADARAAASHAVDKIIAGQSEVLELTSADAIVYLRTRDTLYHDFGCQIVCWLPLGSARFSPEFRLAGPFCFLSAVLTLAGKQSADPLRSFQSFGD